MGKVKTDQLSTENSPMLANLGSYPSLGTYLWRYWPFTALH